MFLMIRQMKSGKTMKMKRKMHGKTMIPMKQMWMIWIHLNTITMKTLEKPIMIEIVKKIVTKRNK